MFTGLVFKIRSWGKKGRPQEETFGPHQPSLNPQAHPFLFPFHLPLSLPSSPLSTSPHVPIQLLIPKLLVLLLIPKTVALMEATLRPCLGEQTAQNPPTVTVREDLGLQWARDPHSQAAWRHRRTVQPPHVGWAWNVCTQHSVELLVLS